jgi:hypothetical protein
MGDHLAVGGGGNAQIAIEKKVAQAAGLELRIAGLVVGELQSAADTHGLTLMLHCNIKALKIPFLKGCSAIFPAKK